MALSPNEWPVLRVRRKIADQPKAIRQLIEKGEKTIDDTLTFPHSSHFGTAADQYGVNVFDMWDKIDNKVRELLTELYEAVGFAVTWKNSTIDGQKTQPNAAILHPRI